MAEQTHGITLELRHQAFDQAIARLREKVSDLSDPGRAIALVLTDSVRQNFEEGGRPNKWQESKRAREQGGQTLRDTDRLYNSITGEFDAANNLVRVGTNVVYAPAHHFGAHQTVVQHVREHVRQNGVRVRAHGRNMPFNLPARPFMMIQSEDWDTISDIIQTLIEEAAL